MKPPEHKRIETTALHVRKSKIPGAGQGLFASEEFWRGQIIIQYKGKITTLKEIQDSGIISHYIYLVNKNYVIDAEDFPESLGRYANDAEGLTIFPGLKNNAKFILLQKKVYLQAIEAIAPGAEILVSYGKPYWDTIRANMEIDKKDKAAARKKGRK